MDPQKLRNLVFEKTGIKVDTTDPIFALVALNDAVLADTVERHVALIEAASAELIQQAHHAAGHGTSPDATHGASHAATSAAAAPAAHGERTSADTHRVSPSTFTQIPTPVAPLAKAIPTQAQPLFAPREWRLLAAAAGLSLLTALVVVGVQALLRKPAPAPVIQALSLTPEQTAALRDAEKLRSAVDKLDAKSRAQVQAALQKP